MMRFHQCAPSQLRGVSRMRNDVNRQRVRNGNSTLFSTLTQFAHKYCMDTNYTIDIHRFNIAQACTGHFFKMVTCTLELYSTAASALKKSPIFRGLPGTYHFDGRDLVSIGHFSPSLYQVSGPAGGGLQVVEKSGRQP